MPETALARSLQISQANHAARSGQIVQEAFYVVCVTRHWSKWWELSGQNNQLVKTHGEQMRGEVLMTGMLNGRARYEYLDVIQTSNGTIHFI